MTTRAEHEYSATEKATHEVLAQISDAISRAHTKHRPPMPEKDFRRMLAGYLSDRTEREWCETLGIDPPEGT